MYKVCIIGVYFGRFLDYFPLWINSCMYNKTINFLIITDQEVIDIPNNVSVINMTFFKFKNMVQEKFEFNISLDKPYKICDFKPAFGLIFEDYLTDYDFWGHCDFDMIFGDLRKYFNYELLSYYEKILPLGHLSIYRNTPENNNRFKMSGSLVGSYKEVFSNGKSYAFDEIIGVYEIYRTNNFLMYDNRIFADISSIYKRFRLAQNDINYNYQIFSFNEGKIIREYFIEGDYNKDEFVYLHVKKPKILPIKFRTNNLNSYFITNTGFYEKKHDASMADIIKYNKFNGYIYETYEKIKYIFLDMCKLVMRKAKLTQRG